MILPRRALCTSQTGSINAPVLIARNVFQAAKITQKCLWQALGRKVLRCVRCRMNTTCSADTVPLVPGTLDPLMIAYNQSIYFDRAFYAQDIAGSIAFARANVTTGILTKDDFASIENGFEQILEEWRTDTFEIKPDLDEDIHTANERRLGEIVGKDTAGKLHTWAILLRFLPCGVERLTIQFRQWEESQ